MDIAGIEASLCFPNLFVRFCGQRFLFAEDKSLALLCVKAYNDFIVDEWCSGSQQRLIPCSIVPLWDPALAAEEVRRMAARGVRAVAFSELPSHLGLPSIHTSHWDAFFAACEETDTAIMLHIGSSSQMPYTSSDAPAAVAVALPSNNSASALVDWLCSGKLVQFPRLRICLAESNIGWVPYFLERLDLLWTEKRRYLQLEALTRPPSSYYYSNLFVTFFHDDFGTHNLTAIGEDNAIFETDYPHGDSTWPDSLKVAKAQTSHLSNEVQEKVLRGNARRLFAMTD
jgi:predicted TIM-barrel fold metal-dependent hydrolase